jgi:hypothetical protein
MRALSWMSTPTASRPPRRRLFVVENGARDLASFLSADGSDETVVVAQGANEAPADLLFRVIGRIAVIERSARSVDRAVIGITSKLDAQSQAARELVARALYAHMTASGSGELVFSSHGADVALRHELVGLVERLLAEHERSTVTIRLQFHGESPRLAPASGVRPAAHSSPELVS